VWLTNDFHTYTFFNCNNKTVVVQFLFWGLVAIEREIFCKFSLTVINITFECAYFLRSSLYDHWIIGVQIMKGLMNTFLNIIT
jgi:hypothetical protein